MLKKIIIILFALVAGLSAQQKDKGFFTEKEPGFWNEIKEGIDEYYSENEKSEKDFKVDLSEWKLPASIDEFDYAWHNQPVSQGNTGTCWAFSTTSFFESEVKRLGDKEVKLAPIYTAYWEYVEKAREYVKSRGESRFTQGSEANAVPRIWKMYGIVPVDVYPGKPEGLNFHSHTAVYDEMYSYLKKVKENNAWNEEEVLATIKAIMNTHLGTPPEKFEVEGNEYTPKTYLNDYLGLKLDDYVDILSYKQQPYYEQVEYEVPDNWWHSDVYYNVPLDEFMATLKNAVDKGYTVSIGGDVSEPGKDSRREVFVVPSFDIPAEFIDEDARQFRFTNGSTTDDHGIHLLGAKKGDDGKLWFLIKDSGAGSFDGPNKGYFFMHEDYVKLKMMDFMVHKDAAGEILNKFGK